MTDPRLALAARMGILPGYHDLSGHWRETPVETAEAVPEKPQPLAPGRLFVQVDPWGNLSIDGRTVGRAPFDGELKPGMHTVTVTNNYFKGQHTFRVKVESGKRVARTIVLEQHLDRIE